MSDLDLTRLAEGFKVRINYHGEKRRKLNCPPGYHPAPNGSSCVPMTAEQKQNYKVGNREAKRTKESAGASLLKKTIKHLRRALKFRKAFGVKS